MFHGELFHDETVSRGTIIFAKNYFPWQESSGSKKQK
jgi:hypothetical protein